MNMGAANKFIDAINENAGFAYIPDNFREKEIDKIVMARDTIDDFKNNQTYLETRSTTKGNIEIFIINNNQELMVMDFGDFRLALKD